MDSINETEESASISPRSDVDFDKDNNSNSNSDIHSDSDSDSDLNHSMQLRRKESGVNLGHMERSDSQKRRYVYDVDDEMWTCLCAVYLTLSLLS